MNQLPQDNANFPVDDHWRDQALLYLLGELNDQQAAEFERQLERSPGLAQSLEDQAIAIADLSIQSRPAQTSLHRSDSKPWLTKAVATMVALAACIAFAIVALQPDGLAESEATRIARAWVETQSVAAGSQAGELLWDAAATLTPVESPATTDVDETLDWMYIAVSMELDATRSGGNDG